jgi:hypothetical protein
MAGTTFQLKRSSVAGKVPNTSTLSIGELGINLTDQKLYSSNGTGVFELGANLTNLTVGSIKANGSYGNSGQVLTSNGTVAYWANGASAGAARIYSITTVSGTQNTFTTSEQFVSGTVDVYLNGVHLSNSEYAEVNSTAIQLTSDATNGAIVEVSGWVTINTLVAGANTTIQFNDSGFINSSPTFTWNKSSERLTVGNSSVNSTVNSTSISIGSNNLTVGTSAYFVSNGNVGIGTSSPSYLLSIENSSTDANYYAGRFYSVANPANTSITHIRIEKGNGYGGTVGGYINQGVGSGLVFSTLNGGTLSNAVWVNNSGNVGIGTSSPSQKIEVYDGNIQTTSTAGSYVRLVRGDVNGALLQLNRGGSANQNAYFGQYQGSLYIKNLDSGSTIFTNTTGDTERMRITSAGNIGIGTSSPATKFHVSGSDNITSVLFSGNTRAVRFFTDTNGTTLEGVDNTGFTTYQPLTIGGSIVTFTINGSEKMRLTSAGNVGIGNSSPSYPLDVNGNINSSNTVFAVHFDNVSDISLKDNISPLTNTKETINQLNPVSFNWKSSGEKSYGLIAQDVEQILPTIVHSKSDGTKTVNYIEIIAFLIAAVKDLQQQIDDIKMK